MPPSSRPARRRLTSAVLAVAALVLSLITVTAVAAPAGAQSADAAYVMGYFRESPNGSGNDNAVHLAVSRDGLEWTPLNENRPILTPTEGTRGIRDPFIHRLRDGTWVLVATDIPNGGNFVNPNPNIHVWTSRDLVTWSADRLLRINAANPRSFSWAPAVHWDPSRSQYGITFSSVPEGYNRPVILVVYTTDFVTTTAPTLFFENPNGGVIDSHVIPGVNGVNYLYYRDDQSRTIRGARSSSLNPGTFTPYGNGVAVNCTEAPTLIRSLTSATWRMWGDTYCPNGVLRLWEGDIAAANWTLTDQRSYTPPTGSKHNTVHAITAATHDALLARYGATTTTRVKSWNLPDSYVRHSSFVGRLDAFPLDPYADAQWRVVPGLSDSSAVSFESVNFPGRYLRHRGFDVVLDPNDGTAGFRADATFVRVAGLADANWTSLRSVNFPTRYVRHVDRVLRLQEVGDAQGRADAMFRLVP